MSRFEIKGKTVTLSKGTALSLFNLNNRWPATNWLDPGTGAQEEVLKSICVSSQANLISLESKSEVLTYHGSGPAVTTSGTSAPAYSMTFNSEDDAIKFVSSLKPMLSQLERLTEKLAEESKTFKADLSALIEQINKLRETKTRDPGMLQLPLTRDGVLVESITPDNIDKYKNIVDSIIMNQQLVLKPLRHTSAPTNPASAATETPLSYKKHWEIPSSSGEWFIETTTKDEAEQISQKLSSPEFNIVGGNGQKYPGPHVFVKEVKDQRFGVIITPDNLKQETIDQLISRLDLKQKPSPGPRLG